MAIKKANYIWVDGELVNWDDAKDHVLALTMHYGLGAFEGIRAYKCADGRTAVFRLKEHIDRLYQSCHMIAVEIPFAREALLEACALVLKKNGLDEAYLRPLVYLGYGSIGLGAQDNPVRTVIAAFEWGAYLGDEGLKKGIRCKTSSFRRASVDSILSKGKLTGQYVTSILAKREALKAGYNEAIMLDQNGHVAEGSGENVFIVRGGELWTPPTSSSVLAGITRDSIIRIARDMGLTVHEAVFTRDEVWIADEVFLTGTAAEVTPVREVDDRRIGAGEPGPVTRKLQAAFFDVVKGASPRYAEWLTYV